MKLVVVMAHRGTEETCLRHIAFWEKEGNVVFFSPADSEVKIAGKETWKFGRRGHHSHDANMRFLMMMKKASQTDYNEFVIHEYDSISFAPVDSPHDHIAGIAYGDSRANRGFVGTTFIHPPLYVGRFILMELIHTLGWVSEMEQFMWDRWLGLACERAKIPIYDLRIRGIGFSKNTIDVEDVPLVAAAIQKGATSFHGVKSAKVFEAICAAGGWS